MGGNRKGGKHGGHKKGGEEDDKPKQQQQQQQQQQKQQQQQQKPKKKRLSSASSDFTPRPAAQLSGHRLSTDLDDEPPTPSPTKTLRRQRSRHLSASDDVFAEEDELSKDHRSLSIPPDAFAFGDDDDGEAKDGRSRPEHGKTDERADTGSNALAPPSATMEEYYEQLTQYIAHDATCDLTLEEMTALAKHAAEAEADRASALIDLGLAPALVIGLQRCEGIPEGQYWLSFAVWRLAQDDSAASALMDADVHIPLIAAASSLSVSFDKHSTPLAVSLLGALGALCSTADSQSTLLAANAATAAVSLLRAAFDANVDNTELQRRACCLIGLLAEGNAAAQHDLHSLNAETLCLRCLPDPESRSRKDPPDTKGKQSSSNSSNHGKGKGKGKKKGKHTAKANEEHSTNGSGGGGGDEGSGVVKTGTDEATSTTAYETRTCALFALAHLSCNSEAAQWLIQHKGFERCAAMVDEKTENETRLDYAFQTLCNLITHASKDQLAGLSPAVRAHVCSAARNALWKTIRVLNSARVVLAHLSPSTVERWAQWTATLGTRWL